MPVVILSFIALIIFGTFFFRFINNRRALDLRSKFYDIAKPLRPNVMSSIRLRYTGTNGGKIYVYPNGTCDLYLFENCLAIVRKQSFGIEWLFAPILISKEVEETRAIFNSFEVYKPDRVTIKQVLEGEIEIKLTDLRYSYYKISIDLKGLSNDQKILLEKMQTWC